jgi:hypothetical protein
MPVKIEFALREGWKSTVNDRFGEVFEVRFVNVDDDRILFRYAPKCDDRKAWEYVFDTLDVYDGKLKELRSIIGGIQGGRIPLSGTPIVEPKKEE